MSKRRRNSRDEDLQRARRRSEIDPENIKDQLGFFLSRIRLGEITQSQVLGKLFDDEVASESWLERIDELKLLAMAYSHGFPTEMTLPLDLDDPFRQAISDLHIAVIRQYGMPDHRLVPEAEYLCASVLALNVARVMKNLSTLPKPIGQRHPGRYLREAEPMRVGSIVASEASRHAFVTCEVITIGKPGYRDVEAEGQRAVLRLMEIGLGSILTSMASRPLLNTIRFLVRNTTHSPPQLGLILSSTRQLLGRPAFNSKEGKNIQRAFWKALFIDLAKLYTAIEEGVDLGPRQWDEIFPPIY